VIARIEPLSGIIRAWVQPDGGYGKPYTFAATVRWVDLYLMEIMGVVGESKTITPSLFRAIGKEAKRWNARRVGYRRFKDGQETVKWFDI
jgi:hypothetical protein